MSTGAAVSNPPNRPIRYCMFTLGSLELASNHRMTNLGQELSRCGFDVSFIVEDTAGNGEFAPDGIKVVHVPQSRSPGSLRERRKALRALNPDYVHVLGPSLKSTAALLGRRRPFVVGDWEESIVLIRPPEGQKLHFAVWRGLDRWLRRRADIHVVVSQYLRQRFKERFGIETIYLPYATYLPPFGAYASPFSEPTLVYLGAIEDRFDFDILVDALERLAAKGITPAVDVIGGGEDRQRWQHLCQEKGLAHMVFRGFLPWDEAKSRLANAHALVFPIRPSPFNLSRCPGKLYPYAQARRPIITCAVGEVPHVLGEKATYVEPSGEAFAHAIEAVMRAPRVDEVDYEIEQHAWERRAEVLAEAVRAHWRDASHRSRG